ncbi:MAG: C1 family peptidase, partial [Candidatus Eisenbacteria bacterium]
MTPTPQQSQSSRHRDGPGRFFRGHANLLVLLGLVSILLLLIALPIDEWLPPSEPSPVEDLPEWISPQTRTRIEQLRATIQRQGKTWTAGYTDISDLDPRQFQALLGARPPKEELLAETAVPGAPSLAASPESAGETDLPARWDWRTRGAITPARAQGQCGSCWAFAAAAALEALAQIYAHRTLDVSEQHALDCNADNSGCAGGWMTAAYRLWRDHGALAEAQVPYTGEDDRPCETEGTTPIARVIEWSSVSSALEDLKRMLLVGPLAVTMHVYPDFQHYREGVYEHEGDDPINHAVLLVGWDDTLGAWIIKNSWGPGWGDAGFAHVRYGSCRLGAYAHRLAISADQPIEIRHQALVDTLAGSPLAIEAMVTSAGSPLDSAAVRVWLDLGHGAEAVHPRWVGSNSHQITFALPLPDLQAGSRVRYWIEAADTDGRLARFPQEGAAGPIEFTIRRIFFSHDLETEPAWRAGLPGDAATAGWWQWGVPEASVDIRMRPV